MKLTHLTVDTYTHVVADLHKCVTFDQSKNSFEEISRAISNDFGITPESIDDLANIWTKHRPDLLIGAVDNDRVVLTVLGCGVSLDPQCSLVVRNTAQSLSIKRIRRILLSDLEFDEWFTEASAATGKIPSLLFHGTSYDLWKSILKNGLEIDRPGNWTRSGINNVYLTATPQTAAFHARRTAALRKSEAIVVATRRPRRLETDWDVENQLVNNSRVPSNDGFAMTKEAGLFACPKRISRRAILAAYTPKMSTPFKEWPLLYQAPKLDQLLSWFFR